MDCACEAVQRSEGPNWFICVSRRELDPPATSLLWMVLLPTMVVGEGAAEEEVPRGREEWRRRGAEEVPGGREEWGTRGDEEVPGGREWGARGDEDVPRGREGWETREGKGDEEEVPGRAARGGREGKEDGCMERRVWSAGASAFSLTA